MAQQLLGDLTGPSAPPDKDTWAVRLSGVTRRFGNRTVLDGIDLRIDRREFVALIGRSGTGKSTLLRGIAGLDDGVEGKVEASSQRAVVFQEPRLLPWRSVWRNVVLGASFEQPRQRALSALREVGLEAHADAWPITLSGGEAQRVALARALVREPELLLLDEPFGALDALTRLRMHELVAELVERHHPGVLLVTHDVDEAIALTDRILVLQSGRFIADIAVDLPRPRLRSQTEFEELRIRLLDLLGIRTF